MDINLFTYRPGSVQKEINVSTSAKFKNDVEPNDYNWNIDFKRTFEEELNTLVKCVVIPIPELFLRTYVKTNILLSPDADIEVYNEFNDFNTDELKFICRCENWDAVKTIILNYWAVDIKEETEIIQEQINKLQQRLDEITPEHSN